MKNTIEAKFEIVTPMFLGDAESDQLADTIRPPSVKGALRFWWRALEWQKLNSGSSDIRGRLTTLHERETALFGNAASEDAGGQSSFLMRVSSNLKETRNSNTVHPDFSAHNGARYLGYGLMTAFPANGRPAGSLERPCIDSSASFTVRLTARSTIDPSIVTALKVFGLIGGLGGRNRRGFGSCALKEISKGNEIIWSAPRTIEAYIGEIHALIPRNETGDKQNPPYSAFSDHSRIDLLTESLTSPFAVLDNLGRAMAMYRSWGNAGMVMGLPREENFRLDHDWKYAQAPRGFHPRRVVFGLPHNYGNTADREIAGATHDRRASPLLLHVHKLGGHYIGVSTLLPAQFLSPNEKIKAGRNLVEANIEWNVLTGFLDGDAKATGAPRFPDKKPVMEAQA